MKLNSGIEIHDESLYRNIVENCADAIIVADADQRITHINKATEAMFGHPSRSIAGQPLDILIPDDIRTKHRSLAERFRNSGESAKYMESRETPIRGLRADGTEFPLNVSILKSGEGDNSMLVAIIRDITVQKKLEAELEVLASIDTLTGILNRRSFTVRAEAEIVRAQRYGHPIAFAMIDIDYFKRINDTFGHAVGDMAIRHAVNIISGGLRTPDILGRWGGEEFALILPETDTKSALITAQRLRSCVENSPFIQVKEPKNPVRMTISIGVAGFNTGEETFDELIDQADQALYVAKRTGRNKVSVFDNIMSEQQIAGVA